MIVLINLMSIFTIYRIKLQLKNNKSNIACFDQLLLQNQIMYNGVSPILIIWQQWGAGIYKEK